MPNPPSFGDVVQPAFDAVSSGVTAISATADSLASQFGDALGQTLSDLGVPSDVFDQWSQDTRDAMAALLTTVAAMRSESDSMDALYRQVRDEVIAVPVADAFAHGAAAKLYALYRQMLKTQAAVNTVLDAIKALLATGPVDKAGLLAGLAAMDPRFTSWLS
jgi:hypothetical protein